MKKCWKNKEFGYVCGIKELFTGRMILHAGLSYWYLKIIKFIN